MEESRKWRFAGLFKSIKNIHYYLNTMSLTIEVELKDVLNGINQKLDMIQKDVTDLKLGQVELKGDIKTLDVKVDGLSTRVSNQELLLRTIVGGLILIVLGGAAKMFWNFPVNP